MMRDLDHFCRQFGFLADAVAIERAAANGDLGAATAAATEAQHGLALAGCYLKDQTNDAR